MIPVRIAGPTQWNCLSGQRANNRENGEREAGLFIILLDLCISMLLAPCLMAYFF
jgi:hypothetical protein